MRLRQLRELDEWFAGGRNVEQPGKLPGLPLDIMHIILDDVSEDFPHLVMFSCTCKAVLASAIGHLQKGLKTLYATWAGARIICLGDSTKCDEDLPVGFLTAVEREEVAFASRDDGEDDDSDDDEFQDDNFGNGGDVPYLLYARDYYQDIYTGYEYPCPGRDRDHDRTQYQRDIRNHTPSRAVAARDIAMFVRLSGLPSTRFSLHEVEYPCEEPVLFNLSKGVCVRSGALRKLATRRGEPLTLMNALLSRICWSGSAPGDNAMHLDEAQHLELGRGKWAGDRFCVSTLEAMPRMVDGREWVDESEETDEFLYHLWRHGERGDELCDEVADTKLASSSPKRTQGDVDSNAEALEPERKKMRKWYPSGDRLKP